MTIMGTVLAQRLRRKGRYETRGGDGNLVVKGIMRKGGWAELALRKGRISKKVKIVRIGSDPRSCLSRIGLNDLSLIHGLRPSACGQCSSRA